MAVAQASTLLAVPLGVIAMLVVLFDSRATKGRALPVWAKAFAVLGAVILLGNAAHMYSRIPDILRSLGLL